MKRFIKKLNLLLAICLMLCCFQYYAFAANDEVAMDNVGVNNVILEDDIAQYQTIVELLNNEYGYNMVFSIEKINNGSCKSPLTIDLTEFEAILRRSIENDIEVNEETKRKINELGDVRWEKGEFWGNSYTLPMNITYYSSGIESSMVSDTISFRSLISNSDNETKSSNTITTIQSRKDPSGNIAFLISSDISPSTVWRYSGVPSFSWMQIGDLTNNPSYYLPKGMSYSKIDSMRTYAVHFTCEYYSSYGVLVNENSNIYREYHTTSDCITNWPNYTVPHTVTNKSYNCIDYFTNQTNCAGYAWGYSDYVTMSKLGLSYTSLNGCSNISELLTLVKNKSNSFMSSHGINATVISAYNSTINPSTQYRVVLKVGYVDTNDNGSIDIGVNPWNDEFDYHWWMQLGDGSWADKRGGFPSRIVPNTNNYNNPAYSLWTMYDYGEVVYNNFYNSTPVYYKITG